MWQITWEGTTWTEADLRVGHIAAICALQGVDSWDELNPLGGPGKLLTMLAVLVASERNEPVDDILAELAKAPALTLLNCITEAPDPAVVPFSPSTTDAPRAPNRKKAKKAG